MVAKSVRIHWTNRGLHFKSIFTVNETGRIIFWDHTTNEPTQQDSVELVCDETGLCRYIEWSAWHLE